MEAGGVGHKEAKDMKYVFSASQKAFSESYLTSFMQCLWNIDTRISQRRSINILQTLPILLFNVIKKKKRIILEFSTKDRLTSFSFFD